MALTVPGDRSIVHALRVGYEQSPLMRAMLNTAGWLLYGTVLMLLALLVAPFAIESGQHAHYWIVVGGIGLWRYTVGITHFFRAMLFLYVIYPIHKARAKALRHKADPSHLYFLVTSFRIDSNTAAAVYSAVIEEAVTCGYDTTIVASIVEMGDERLIRALWEKFDPPPRTRLRIVRIPGTGKRDGLAQGFRAISRDMPDADAVVAVVDGDTVLLPGVMRKTAPFLKLFPRVGALTTNEICDVEGSYVMSEWHKLRFAQRHVQMSSMALGRRVLTLTGRMSMFRARVVTDPDFIADVQNDSLDHWRLGKFRFLTGDDKSSWFSLMKNGWDTYYVPDAGILTLESPPASQSFFTSSRQLMFRWFGNSLRQNSRALRLGPGTLGWFTTYVLLDQRATMWTSLLGPTAAILGTIKYGMPILLTYILWVGMTRLVMTLILVLTGHRIGPAFPVILYYNQIMGSLMKIYVFFRLDQQSWTRQKTTLHRDLDAFQVRFNDWSSKAMTFTAIMVFAAFVVTLI